MAQLGFDKRSNRKKVIGDSLSFESSIEVKTKELSKDRNTLLDQLRESLSKNSLGSNREVALSKISNLIDKHFSNQDFVADLIHCLGTSLRHDSPASCELRKLMLEVLLKEEVGGDVRNAAASALQGVDDEGLIKNIANHVKGNDSLALDATIACIKALKGTTCTVTIGHLKEMVSPLEDNDIKIAIMDALVPSDCKDKLVDFIKSRVKKDPDSAFAALPNLRLIRKEGPSITDYLIKKLGDEDPRIRRHAAMGLYGLTKQEKDTVSRLVHLALNANSAFGQQVVVVLQNSEYHPRKTLKALTKSKNPDVRNAAIRALNSKARAA